MLTHNLILGFAVAFNLEAAPAFSPDMTETLPVCQSGWKLDDGAWVAYIPSVYIISILKEASDATVVHVVNADGEPLADVHKGERVQFNCFDPLKSSGCKPGDTCG